MTGTDDLGHVLRRLKLSGVLQTLDLGTRQAVDENLDQQEFLYRLLNDEIERRDGKKLQERIARRIRARPHARGVQLAVQREDPEGAHHRPREVSPIAQTRAYLVRSAPCDRWLRTA